MACADGEAIRDFPVGRLREFRALASFDAPINREWRRSTPAEIRTSTGTMYTALLAALISIMHIGDSPWASKFTHGCPITVYLIQSGVLPPAKTPSRHSLVRAIFSKIGRAIPGQRISNKFGARLLRNHSWVGLSQTGI